VSQALKGKKQNIPFQKEADKQKTILWNSKQTNSKSLEIKIHSPFLSDRFFWFAVNQVFESRPSG